MVDEGLPTIYFGLGGLVVSDWSKIFADARMQRLEPNPELLAALPAFQAAGLGRVLDAGCGAGRHLLPLAAAGFLAWGVDREQAILDLLKARLQGDGPPARRAFLVRADLARLPFPAGVFDLAVSINVVNHGTAAQFRAYCRELDRTLRPGGHLFLYVSPREFGELVRRPQTREPEPGTLVDIATPDGDLVHHFPTPGELREQFPGYGARRFQTLWAPIPFMDHVLMPQLLFWGEKHV